MGGGLLSDAASSQISSGLIYCYKLTVVSKQHRPYVYKTTFRYTLDSKQTLQKVRF